MDIKIIGPGNMGRAIGTRAIADGHSVTFVGKTLESARKAADEIRASAQQGDVFMAGDDGEAKNKVARLIEDAGLRPVDAGPLNRARQIAGMGFLHIVTQGDLGTNYASAMKVVSETDR